MENLLPTVAAADVTSDEFREKTLPYQQWEVERTHVAPGTPLDIRHLLPPIGSQKSRRVLSDPLPIAPHSESSSIAPRTELSFPQPAPVDRNLSDLYDPALDPSPIGMEDRGIVQQIRSTRIVPRRELPGAAKVGSSRGGGVSGASRQGGSDCSGGATVVTVFNGYEDSRGGKKIPPGCDSGGGGVTNKISHTRDTDIGSGGGVAKILPTCGRCRGGDGDGEGEGCGEQCCCVDVFVQGFSSAGIEHATLIPSAVFRRALHRKPINRLAAPDISSSCFPEEEEAKAITELREEHLGLTVFLARAGDWSDYDNAPRGFDGGGASHRRGIGTAHDDRVITPEFRSLNHVGSDSQKSESWRMQSEWTHSERIQSERMHSERAQSERMQSERIQSARTQSERMKLVRTQSERMYSERMQSQSGRMQSQSEPMQSESTTRIIFEREDGTPGPSQNAFRVQFEPGPLGMELEEDPDQRGVVRIRRLLQAGQAEHDGRFSVGCLVVAVGDWDGGHDDSISDDIVLANRCGRGGQTGRSERSGPTERSEQTGRSEQSGPTGRSERSGPSGRSTSAPLGNKRLTTTAGTPSSSCPVLIRSLRQLEEAVSGRKDGQLFVVWALDRLAPEAIAALGIPRPTSAQKLSHRWPSNILHSRHKELYRAEAVGFGSDGQGAHHEHVGSSNANSRGSLYSASTRFSRSGDGMEGQGGGVARWQSNRAFGGRDRSRFSLSADERKVSPHDCGDEGGGGGEAGEIKISLGSTASAASGTSGGSRKSRESGASIVRPVRPASRARPATSASEASGDSQEGTMESENIIVAGSNDYPLYYSARGAPPPPRSASREKHAPRKLTGGSDEDEDDKNDVKTLVTGGVRDGRGGGGWEFETGGGIFDEDDQGLAGRKQPRCNEDVPEYAYAVPGEEKRLLPLGLQASTADDVAVCLWFCNNHDSATMKVSWIDYAGKRVFRRSLEPGACYFERSFATHPWVVEYSFNHGNKRNDDHNNKSSGNNNNSHNNDNSNSNNNNNNDNDINNGNDNDNANDNSDSHNGNNNDNDNDNNNTTESYRETNGPVAEGEPAAAALQETTPPAPFMKQEVDGDCCVIRLGEAMAVAQFSGSLIWNPAGKTFSVTKQARIGVSGMSSSAVATVGASAGDGAGLDPGKKRLCMAGALRDSDAASAVVKRATVRAAKARILEEMRMWRTQPLPSGGAGAGGRSAATGGLGQGAPNLRIVMMGSSSCNSGIR